MAEKTWIQKFWWVIPTVVVFVIILFISIGYFGVLNPSMMLPSRSVGASFSDSGGSYSESLRSSYNSLSPVANQDFAPDIKERQLIKTSSIAMETKRGQFSKVQTSVNNIIKSSGAIVLSENFQTFGKGSQTYDLDTYQIKIETSKYDSVAAQLRDLGGVVSFSETATDVTGAITNRQIEIAAEKERLRRYELLVGSSGYLNDKITLTDRIFEQDRRIKYLEDGLQNTQQQVAYSTINLRLTEKIPTLYGVALVGIGSLFKTLVGSLNALLYFISAILPWMLVVVIIVWVIILIRNRVAR